MKLTLRTILILVGAVAGVAALGFMLAPKPIDVVTEVLEKGQLLVTVDEDGFTRIHDTYIFAAPFSGRMLRSDLEPGDRVVRGETVLARIEPPPVDLLDERAATQARAQIKAAQATLEQVEPVIEQAEIALEYAQEELDRANRLFQQNNLAEAQRDKIELSYKSAQHELQRAELNRNIARFELEMAQAALLQAGAEGPRSAQPHFEIISPISGLVLRQWHKSETILTSGTQLLEVGDPQDLEVVVDVLSSDAVQITPQAPALLEDWGGDLPLDAVVRLVEPQGFTKISALGVEEQRVNVILDLVGDRQLCAGLGAGFRVHARIVVYQREDVLKAPVSALFREGPDWAALVVENGRAHLRRLEVGRRNDLQAEILKGCAVGDVVVLHPSDKVSDGTRVRGAGNSD